jgi:hypothetical protein
MNITLGNRYLPNAGLAFLDCDVFNVKSQVNVLVSYGSLSDGNRIYSIMTKNKDNNIPLSSSDFIEIILNGSPNTTENRRGQSLKLSLPRLFYIIENKELDATAELACAHFNTTAVVRPSVNSIKGNKKNGYIYIIFESGDMYTLSYCYYIKETGVSVFWLVQPSPDLIRIGASTNCKHGGRFEYGTHSSEVVFYTSINAYQDEAISFRESTTTGLKCIDSYDVTSVEVNTMTELISFIDVFYQTLTEYPLIHVAKLYNPSPTINESLSVLPITLFSYLLHTSGVIDYIVPVESFTTIPTRPYNNLIVSAINYLVPTTAVTLLAYGFTASTIKKEQESLKSIFRLLVFAGVKFINGPHKINFINKFIKDQRFFHDYCKLICGLTEYCMYNLNRNAYKYETHLGMFLKLDTTTEDFKNRIESLILKIPNLKWISMGDMRFPDCKNIIHPATKNMVIDESVCIEGIFIGAPRQSSRLLSFIKLKTKRPTAPIVLKITNKNELELYSLLTQDWVQDKTQLRTPVVLGVDKMSQWPDEIGICLSHEGLPVDTMMMKPFEHPAFELFHGLILWCANVVDDLHAIGYCFGDFKLGNVLATSSVGGLNDFEYTLIDFEGLTPSTKFYEQNEFKTLINHNIQPRYYSPFASLLTSQYGFDSLHKADMCQLYTTVLYAITAMSLNNGNIMLTSEILIGSIVTNILYLTTISISAVAMQLRTVFKWADTAELDELAEVLYNLYWDLLTTHDGNYSIHAFLSKLGPNILYEISDHELTIFNKKPTPTGITYEDHVFRVSGTNCNSSSVPWLSRNKTFKNEHRLNTTKTINEICEKQMTLEESVQFVQQVE